MKKFICIAKCPELDSKKIKHCTDTEDSINKKQENGYDYCPCGNHEIWSEIREIGMIKTTNTIEKQIELLYAIKFILDAPQEWVDSINEDDRQAILRKINLNNHIKEN